MIISYIKNTLQSFSECKGEYFIINPSGNVIIAGFPASNSKINQTSNSNNEYKVNSFHK